jgi:hypothetical protein
LLVSCTGVPGPPSGPPGGAPSVPVNSEGRSEVGISWPTSARRLAPPMPRTAGVSHRSSGADGSAVAGVALTSASRNRHQRVALRPGCLEPSLTRRGLRVARFLIPGSQVRVLPGPSQNRMTNRTQPPSNPRRRGSGPPEPPPFNDPPVCHNSRARTHDGCPIRRCAVESPLVPRGDKDVRCLHERDDFAAFC